MARVERYVYKSKRSKCYLKVEWGRKVVNLEHIEALIGNSKIIFVFFRFFWHFIFDFL